MKHTRWFALLLVGTGPLLAAGTAHAQGRFPPPEPKKYIHFNPAGDLSQILNGRLLEMGARLELDRLRKQFGDKGLLAKLNQQSLSDLPALKKLIENRYGTGEKDPKLDPQKLQEIERFLKQPTPPPPQAGKPPEPKGHFDPPGQSPANPGGGPGMDNPPVERDVEPPTADAGLQERLSAWAQDFAHRLEGTQLGDRLRESPAWQSGMKALEGFLTDRIGGKFPLPGGGGLGPFGERLGMPGDWGALLPDPSRFHLPDISLPSLHRPRLNFSLPRPSFGGSVVPGGVHGASDWGGARVLLWVGLFALIGLLLWQLARRAPRQPGGGDAGGWQLGLWPVDPARVTTRAELVQAFEYLALLRLGRDARAWNHRDIAAHLGGADAARGQAAGELAALYEKARYAPDDEPLAAPDLGTARRNLCLLAGVATA